MINKPSLLLLLVLFPIFLIADSLSIIVVGDIMMGSTYPQKNLPPDNGTALFADVASILQSADLALGNLEGPLLTGGICQKEVKKGMSYAFRTPPNFAQDLTAAGFDFLNLANNHMNDFGDGGIESTIEALAENGIECGGPAGKSGLFEIKGSNIAIVCFATSPGTNSLLDIEQAQAIVAEQARKSQIVIVSFHGGGEGINFIHTKDAPEYFLGAARGNVVGFAHAVIDSGADFVWGHGPHVPRALEIYKERLIAYSLGNFFTWGFNLNDERGLAPMLKVTLDSVGTFLRGRIFSALQETHTFLGIDPLNRAAKVIKRLSEVDFPKTAPCIDEDATISPYLRTQLTRQKFAL